MKQYSVNELQLCAAAGHVHIYINKKNTIISAVLPWILSCLTLTAVSNVFSTWLKTLLMLAVAMLGILQLFFFCLQFLLGFSILTAIHRAGEEVIKDK